MSAPTPRTDAQCSPDKGYRPELPPLVTADFARELERELAAKDALIAKLREALTNPRRPQIMSDDLDSKSDVELNELFAVEVAGWKRETRKMYGSIPPAYGA
jgi:hypothetical protein